MKKALITTLLIILLSAGIIFSAGNFNVSAEETQDHIYIESLDVSGYDVFFEVENADIKEVIIEYSYYEDDLLLSKLKRFDVVKVAINTSSGLSKYHFIKPSEALSFKIWRIANDSTLRSTMNGEFIYSELTALSEVKARVKQIIVDNDLITKEEIYSSSIAARNFKFVMHFDLVDEEGETVPIDNIIRLSVRYNVIQTGIVGNTESVSKVIEQTTFYPGTSFPFLIPERVTQNISHSFDEDYTWMIELGTYTSGPHIPIISPGNVTIDKTQLLTIDYMYDGVFYEDQVVIDEPYDKDDVIHVYPGTTDPYESIWVRLLDLVNNLDNIFSVILIVVGGLVGIFVLSLITKAFNIVKFIFKIAIGLVNFVLKIIKYIMVDIPGYLTKFILFLIVPKDRRKEHIDVSRYL